MQISPRGLALIKQYEGFSALRYLCPAGYWTIGYGHVLQTAEAAHTMNEEEASELLAQDIRAIMRLVSAALSQNQFDALCSFAFNLGAGALQRSTLRRKINNNEHDCVPAELLRWVYAGGRILPGLLARRRAEGQLYATENP